MVIAKNIAEKTGIGKRSAGTRELLTKVNQKPIDVFYPPRYILVTVCSVTLPTVR
jgi:hypothetical protein